MDRRQSHALRSICAATLREGFRVALHGGLRPVIRPAATPRSSGSSAVLDLILFVVVRVVSWVQVVERVRQRHLPSDAVLISVTQMLVLHTDCQFRGIIRACQPSNEER